MKDLIHKLKTYGSVLIDAAPNGMPDLITPEGRKTCKIHQNSIGSETHLLH